MSKNAPRASKPNKNYKSMIRAMQQALEGAPPIAPPSDKELCDMYARMQEDNGNPMEWNRLQREEEEICSKLGMDYTEPVKGQHDSHRTKQ